MKVIKCYLFFLFMSASTIAQHQLPADTGRIHLRKVDEALITSYKLNDAFNYDRSPEPKDNWWGSFLRWIWSAVQDMLRTRQGKTVAWTVIITVLILIIGFAFLYWKRMNQTSLFERKAQKISFSVSDDNIHAISYEEALQQAVAASDYRLAIRLLFLQSLKILADGGIIHWHINKTNEQYLKEVDKQIWKDDFKVLTQLFEFAWYGEATITRNQFDEVNRAFQNFNSCVK